jgi:hypothetical protein
MAKTKKKKLNPLTKSKYNTILTIVDTHTQGEKDVRISKEYGPNY